MVEEQECVGHEMGPLNFTCWKHKWGFHNRGVIWGSGEGWIQKWRMHPPKKTVAVPALVRAIHVSPLQIKITDGGIRLRKERELDPLLLVLRITVTGIELVIRGDSKTIVDCINGKRAEGIVWGN